MNTLNLSNTVPPSVVRDTTIVEHANCDIPGLRHETKDVLKQLQMNLGTLEDLGARLEFALREVRTLIKR